VDAHAEAAVGERFEGKGVVKVFGVVGVDGEDGAVAVIEAAFGVGGWHGVRQVGDLIFDLGGEGGVELEFAVNAEQLGPGFEGLAKDLRDFAAEGFAGVFPRVEGGDDFIVKARGEGGVAQGGIGDEYFEGETGIIRKDNELGADFSESADDLRAGAGQHLEDAAAGFVGSGIAGSEGCVAAGVRCASEGDGHDVAREGMAGVAGADLNIVGQGGLVVGAGVEGGDDKGGAALAELDAAGDGVVGQGRGGRAAGGVGRG